MACPNDMECPIDLENSNCEELLHFAMYGEPAVFPNNDPLKVTYLPAEKQYAVPKAEADDELPVCKKKLSKPSLTLNRLPEQLEQDAKDDTLPIYRRSYIMNFDWASRFPGEEYQDYDKYLEVDENRPTPRMCGLLTMVIFKLLVYLEGYLKLILEKTMSDASVVDSKLLELESLEDLVGPRKRSWMNVFGMPYFKDDRYFTCPVNKDVQNKKQNNELLVIELQQFCDWNANDTDKLEKAIAKEEIVKRRLQLSKAIDAAKDAQKKTELKWKLKALPSLKQINKMTSLKEFGEDLEWEYDWLKIAAQSFQGLKHPDECRSAWHICLHPKINRSTWSDEENEKLKELAKDYNFQNWDAIAKELGTNRTPFVVMQHFQRHLNKDFINKTWTEEEDNLLAQLVDSCRFGSRISWKKIAQQLKGHTKQQIFKHWTYSVNPNLRKGPFTKSEDMLLVAAVRSYGENYGKLLELFPYRSHDQLHSRYRVLTKLNRNPLDENEIEKLLALVIKFGERRWEEISEYFSDRTPASLREEYATFKERMQRFADSNHNLSETDYIEEETACEEQKLWRKVQQVYPDLTEYGGLDINGLRELKRMLIKEPMLPQNIRTTSPFDKECITYFKCVTHVRIALYENDLYENKERLEKPEVLKYILHLVHAKLQTPNESLLSSHPLVKGRDWYLLQELSEESFMVSEERQEPADKVHLKYCLPPNFITLGGFCSIMLHRRYILDKQDQEKEEEEVSEQAVEADCLFKKRFRFLFLWPALASAEPPALRQPPRVEDPVVYSSEYMVPRKRKRRPTRTELLNIFEPKKKQKYTKNKLKQESIVNIEKDASGPSEAAIPSISSSVDNIHKCTVIEIRDESIYQTLLAAEKKLTNTTTRSLCSSSEENDKLQRNIAFTTTSSPHSSLSEKNQNNTTTRSLCSSSEENDKLQRNTAFTTTSSPCSSSSEKNQNNTTTRSLCSSSEENDKLQRNTAFTTTSSSCSSSSEKNQNNTTRSLCSSSEKNYKLQRNTAFTTTRSPCSSSEKNQNNTTTTSLCSSSEENDKLQRNTAFTTTSSSCSSSSEKNKKQQTNMLLTCADLPGSSTSGNRKKQQADVPLFSSAGTFSINNVKCLRTYSRVKKPKTQAS